MKSDGVLIILAYPEEFVAMVPTWYKKPLEWINVVQDGMICAGHSACVLINKATGILEYTDFGRYIAPFGKGRARTLETDPEVEMEVLAKFDADNKIENLEEIYTYIYNHPEKTHGAGTLYVSLNYNIDYIRCSEFIKEISNKGSVPYGPFRKDRTNCSRYVKDVILSGLSEKLKRRKLKLSSSFTASPLGNVFYGLENSEIYKLNGAAMERYTKAKLPQIVRHFFIKKEDRPKKLFQKSHPGSDFQWLGGIGAGSWFGLDQISESKYNITRLQSSGEQIFSKIFEITAEGFEYGSGYKFVYDCNAKWCTIRQSASKFVLRS
jgi:hypothetical protein